MPARSRGGVPIRSRMRPVRPGSVATGSGLASAGADDAEARTTPIRSRGVAVAPRTPPVGRFTTIETATRMVTQRQGADDAVPDHRSTSGRAGRPGPPRASRPAPHPRRRAGWGRPGRRAVARQDRSRSRREFRRRIRPVRARGAGYDPPLRDVVVSRRRARRMANIATDTSTTSNRVARSRRPAGRTTITAMTTARTISRASRASVSFSSVRRVDAASRVPWC